MRVESLSLYPVKATRGVPVETADVELAGLRHDRRWAIVDADGKRLNATRHDRLLAVTARPDPDGGLMLSATGFESLVVDVPIGGSTVAVDVSRLAEMTDAGDRAADWFTDYLGFPVRLAWLDDPARRPMSSGHGGLPDDALSLADAGPLLLTSTASLEQLNDWIHEEDPTVADMVMQRFRPNVVVDAEAPFAEDDWRMIRIGEVDYRFAEICDRCMVTTIDPESLLHGKEPIRSLARHRQWEHKTWFGIRIVPLSTGTITVGDAVHVTTG